MPLEEQLKQKEDTLGRLQNDLSVARETINSLRQEIEMLTHNNTHSRSTTRPRGNTVGEIRSGEERAMDFLVHQYLSRQGYKMSAVTFLSEVI